MSDAQQAHARLMNMLRKYDNNAQVEYRHAYLNPLWGKPFLCTMLSFRTVKVAWSRPGRDVPEPRPGRSGRPGVSADSG